MLKRTITQVDLNVPPPSKIAKSNYAADAASASRAQQSLSELPSSLARLQRTPTPEDIPMSPPPRRMIPPADPRKLHAQAQDSVAGPSSPRHPFPAQRGTKGLMEAVLEFPRLPALSRTQTPPDLSLFPGAAVFPAGTASARPKLVPLRRFPTRPTLAALPVTHTPRRLRCYTSLLPQEGGPRRTRLLNVFAPAPGTKMYRPSGAYWYKRALRSAWDETGKRDEYFKMRARGAHIA